MNIDEMLNKTFQYEIDNQHFREPNQEEIMRALNPQKTVSHKKSWFVMAFAAAVLGCFVFALFFVLPVNKMPMGPLAKIITMNLPENPEEQFLSFVQTVRSGMYPEK